MTKAKENAYEKHDYEISFKDSPEKFVVENCKMIPEETLIRFICFDGDDYKEEVWYPAVNIYRIKRYKK